MKNLLRASIIFAHVAGVSLTVGLALVSPDGAKAQTPNQQQATPQDQMPMMGPGMMNRRMMGEGQDRWMRPRRDWMGQERDQQMGPGMGSWMGRGYSMARHMFYMHNGIPSDYRGKFSPLASSPDIVRDGAVLYAENCASCHGARGFGDGEAGRVLNPRPANLAHMIRMPMLNDEYLLWTIAEGGAPVGSEMPAFKEILTENEMWKIVAAMRAGFPMPPQPEAPAGREQQRGEAPSAGPLSVADVRAQMEQWIVWYGNSNLKIGSIAEKDENMIVGQIVTQDNSLVQRIEVDRGTGWMRPVP